MPTRSYPAALHVSKLVATGNDFLFIDAREPLQKEFGVMPRAELAKRLCDRHCGIGADGVVFVESGSALGRLKWDFHNSDGSTAEMCGNATRCMGRWAQVHLTLNEVVFETVAGLVRAKVEGEMVRSELSFASTPFVFREIRFEAKGAGRTAFLIDTGVPHAVVDIDDLARAEAKGDAVRALRFHPDAGLKGANVTFLETRGPFEFRTVTFERGVEGFTLSCGTGVLAAAAIGLSRSGGMSADVIAPGGRLKVQYDPGRNGVALTGPAKFLFTTTLSGEFLK